MAPRRDREALALSKEDIAEAWGSLSLEDQNSLLEVVRGEASVRNPLEMVATGPKFQRLPRCEGLRYNLATPEDPSFESFVSQLKRFFLASQIDGNSSFAVSVAGLHLEGEATIAWQDQVGGDCKSLSEWCGKLVDKARPVSTKTLAGMDFLRMAKLGGESMADFVLRFNTKLGQVDLAEIPVLRFVLGCPELMRPELLAIAESGQDG